MNTHKLGLFSYAIFNIISILIITDFILPGNIIKDEIITVNKKRQQYYNAAKNYHYTYTVVTNKHSFLITKDFARSTKDHKKIQYSVSKIFKEINWYNLITSKQKSVNSFRIMSGLIVPVLLIVSIFFHLKFNKKIPIIVFVLQTLVIADLIFLMT